MLPCGCGHDLPTTRRRMIRHVNTVGWSVVWVRPEPPDPGWGYSVGLYRSFGHPEIVVVGLPEEITYGLINGLGRQVRSGRAFVADSEYRDLVERYGLVFKTVKRRWYARFLCFASWYYKGDGFPALQCVWPDPHHRYPWEAGFNHGAVEGEPMLFVADPRLARLAGTPGSTPAVRDP